MSMIPAVSSPTVSSSALVPRSYGRRSRPEDLRETELVETYRELVLRIAGQIQRRSPPSVQRDDLVAAGMSGLWDALRRRHEHPEETFDFYVCRRVRGAIIDELRAEDWLPRRRSVEARAAGSACCAVVHYDDLGRRERRRASFDPGSDSEELVGRKRVAERVRAGLERLPARERHVLMMRDLDGVPIKDLGAELGVSKPRVCQLRSQALRRLRSYLEDAA